MTTLPLRHTEGKYEILEKIKEGGMGAIYKVRHLLLDEIRVIKVIRPQISDSQDLQRRFAREARAAIRLKHPNIAQLYDFAVEPDGVAYMVMEFIDGVTLQEMLARNGPAPLDLTLEIARQGLQALRYLHLQGYVHRDIAPDNLMLSKDYDGRPLVKLIDLGIVKHLEGGGEGLTATGMFLGKVRYSSPEQFSGEKGGVDHRSDLYSFGVMLYELLTGKCPILGENLSQLVAAHLFQPPLSFEQTDPRGRVPPEVREVVLRALEKAPAKRPASAQEFHDLLAQRPPAETLSQDLEDTLSVTISLRQEDRERPPVGTTQDKLDAQFGLVRTPRPEASLRAVDAAGGPTEAEQIERLLGDAQRLVREQQWEGARRSLYRALGIHPDHSEARQLLSSVERSLEQAIAQEKQRQQGIANAVESIEALLGAEQLQQAVEALQGARSGYGEDARFSALSARIAELRGVLAERERQLAISRAVASIEDLLRQERAADAGAALASAIAAHGSEPRFVELGERAEQLAAALEERRREQAVAARGVAIAELLARERADEAAAALAGARAELGEDPRFATLEAELAALRTVLAAREREAALAAALASIETALGKEDAEAAAAALESAVRRFGSEERVAVFEAELDRLRRRLAERKREKQAAARRRRAQALLAAAAEHAARRDYSTAIANAAQAAELDPESDAPRVLLEYRQAEVEEREARRRVQALASAVTTIEALLEREAVGEAATALGEARRELGDDVRLGELERRLEALRATLDERRRQQDIAAAVAAVERQLTAQDADAAQRHLEAAVTALGDDERLARLRERVATLQRELAEKERRLALAQAIAAIEERLRAEQVGEATGALEHAIDRLGEEPPLVALRQRILELRQRLEQRARSEALARVEAAVRSLAVGERFDEAEKALAGARAQHGEDPVFAGLAQHVASARREWADRRRNQAIARVAAEVGRRVDTDVEDAARLLELAVREHGANPRFAAAAERIEETRRRLEQAAREQVAREQAARERAATEQAAREQAAAAREQAASEQAARERAAAELDADTARAQPVVPVREVQRRRAGAPRMVAAVAAAGLLGIGGVLWLRSRSPEPSTSTDVALDGPVAEVNAPPDEADSRPQRVPARQAPDAPPLAMQRPALPAEPAIASRDADPGQTSRSPADPAAAGSAPSSLPSSGPAADHELGTSSAEERGAVPPPREAERSAPVALAVETILPSPADETARRRTGSPPNSARDSATAVAPRGRPVESPPTRAAERPEEKASISAGASAPASAASQPGVSVEKRDPIVVPPILKNLPQPRLPALAERQRRQAVILVRVLIDEQGKVLEAEVQDDAAEKKIFFEEAVRVARMATFEAGTRDGVKSRMYSTIPVQFRLRN